MPEWLSWLALPKLTGAEYAKRKAEYIAENGYTVTIPGLSDIIKIPTQKPMSDQEHVWWKTGAWENFSPERYYELVKEKQKRKDRFESMMASPSPQILTNIGSIMTAVDDAQDGLNTLAMIGQIARRVAPKAIAKLLAGPVGVLMTAADILNLVQAIPQQCASPMSGKRVAESFSRASPLTKKGKAHLAKKLGRTMPTKGDLIQAFQTTDTVFGLGVSLGPIVGLLQDIVTAHARTAAGQRVKVKLPIPDIKHWFKAAMKVAKASTLLFGVPHATDDDEVLQWIVSTELAWQQLTVINREWNPLDQVENIADLQVKALAPWHSQTLDVLREGKIDIGKSTGWPQTNTLWANIVDIADRTHPTASENLVNFIGRNKHSWRGFTGASAAAEGAMFAITMLEGMEFVEYDYNVGCKMATSMLRQSRRLDPYQPIEKFESFMKYMQFCENVGHNPTFENIASFCEGPAGIKLLNR